MDYTQYEFIKQKYNGILEIYPRKAMNSFVYESVMRKLNKTHKLFQITSDWIRAFEIK